MAQLGFVGLGNMGGPMAQNLVAAGHSVTGFDLNPASLERAEAAGVAIAESATAVTTGAEAVITMLPAGQHVRTVMAGEGGLIAAATPARFSSTARRSTSPPLGPFTRPRRRPAIRCWTPPFPAGWPAPRPEP